MDINWHFDLSDQNNCKQNGIWRIFKNVTKTKNKTSLSTLFDVYEGDLKSNDVKETKTTLST